jgi:hypothetical protein
MIEKNDYFIRKMEKRGPVKYPLVGVTFPSPISRALIEKGYNRIKMTISEEGILIVPFIDAGTKQGNLDVAVLPEFKEVT